MTSEEYMRDVAISIEAVRQRLLYPDGDLIRDLVPEAMFDYMLAADFLQVALRHLNRCRLIDGRTPHGG